jgi:sterol 3beta-glucosyltransferase
MPIYYAYSPTVLSPPVEWPDRMQVTGYWFLDPPPGWQPPADLLHFLQTGPAPVTIGFGSMASRDAEPH